MTIHLRCLFSSPLRRLLAFANRFSFIFGLLVLQNAVFEHLQHSGLLHCQLERVRSQTPAHRQIQNRFFEEMTGLQ
jgi:hypothetical protein